MFSGLKKTGITQNNNNGAKKRERYQEVRVKRTFFIHFFKKVN